MAVAGLAVKRQAPALQIRSGTHTLLPGWDQGNSEQQGFHPDMFLLGCVMNIQPPAPMSAAWSQCIHGKQHQLFA